jgi:hypothetical protein
VASLGFVFVVAIIVVPIPATAPVASLGFVFVAASVAFYTDFEVGDSFLSVLAGDASDRMLVAPVTGVAIECVRMARLTVAGGVVAIEAEVLLMLECCGCPSFEPMAAAAVVSSLAMQNVLRGARFVAAHTCLLLVDRERLVLKRRGCPSFEPMAAVAVVANLAMQNVLRSACVMAFATRREDIVSDEFVSEDDTGSGSICAEVIAMTSSTSRLNQVLVKRWPPLGWFDGHARRRQKADHFEFVTGDALRGWRSTKRGMAGGAIVGDLFVALDEVAWAHGDFGNP